MIFLSRRSLFLKWTARVLRLSACGAVPKYTTTACNLPSESSSKHRLLKILPPEGVRSVRLLESSAAALPRVWPLLGNSEHKETCLLTACLPRELCEQRDDMTFPHAGIQGTSKSAHYHVLHDDTGTSIDELEAFTYYTTYLYCRQRPVCLSPCAVSTRTGSQHLLSCHPCEAQVAFRSPFLTFSPIASDLRRSANRAAPICTGDPNAIFSTERTRLCYTAHSPDSSRVETCRTSQQARHDMVPPLLFRCTRSVGRCPPAYYAHLCAVRGRIMLSRTGAGSSSDSESGRASWGPSGGGSSASRIVEWAQIHPDLEERMYYV